MTSQTGNDATNRFVDHGFLLMFNTYYLSGMHSLKVTPIFLIVDYGGISISTARGRLTPEVTSQVDRATMVFYSCLLHLPSILYRFDVISSFVIAGNGRKTISAARGRSKPEVKSPFDSLTPIWYRSVLEFFDYLLPVQCYSTFSICM
jgi:hypothetical protein